MYITKYWKNYIGDTDDSLNLVAYLEDKKKPTISLTEIFTDLGLDKLNGDFTKTTVPLEFTHSNGICMDFHFAIDIVTDLAAILLECKMNDGVNLHDLDPYDTPDFAVCVTTTPEEADLMNKTLQHFIANPLSYDLNELVPEDDMKEMASLCEELRQELFN